MKTALGLPLLLSEMPQLRGTEPGSQGRLLELELQAEERWIDVGGRSSYLYGFNGQIPIPLWMLIQAITSASGSVTACPSPPICTITGCISLRREARTTVFL